METFKPDWEEWIDLNLRLGNCKQIMGCGVQSHVVAAQNWHQLFGGIRIIRIIVRMHIHNHIHIRGCLTQNSPTDECKKSGNLQD